MTCHQPNEDLLLVIDMQNVYTDGQPWACCGVEQQMPFGGCWMHRCAAR